MQRHGRNLTGYRMPDPHATQTEAHSGETSPIAPDPDRVRVQLAKNMRPYVTLKAAATLDGKIATRTGESQWITGEAARRHAHRVRAGHDAVLVGRGTLVADNPRLTVRLGGPQPSPARVVLASTAEVSPMARAFAEDGARRIVIVGAQAPGDRIAALESRGVEVMACPSAVPEAATFLPRLRDLGINTLLVEGGGRVHGHLIAHSVADELLLYLAGCLMGDPQAPDWCGPLGVTILRDAPRLTLVDSLPLEGDMLLRGTFR